MNITQAMRRFSELDEKRTPGEWYINEPPDHLHRLFICGKDVHPADAKFGDFNFTVNTSYSENARFLAAAPQIYRVAKQLMEMNRELRAVLEEFIPDLSKGQIDVSPELELDCMRQECRKALQSLNPDTMEVE